MKPKVTRDKLEQLWRDPVNWKRGLIYSCKDDPRIVVPKKQKWRGWTINFAHRCATPTLILMILAAGLPVFLLATVLASRKNGDYQRATGPIYRASFNTGGYRRLTRMARS
jgi:hypothetical protein